MMTFQREHKCRDCGKRIAKKLPTKADGPQQEQLVRVWLRTWLKLKDERCNSCFGRNAGSDEQESFARFEETSKPFDMDGILRGLQFAATNVSASGLTMEKSKPYQGTVVQFPEEFRKLVESLPRLLEDNNAQLRRIADKLDTFSDFSNVMEEGSDLEGETGEPNYVCPHCETDDQLFESYEDDPVSFYCRRCDKVLEALLECKNEENDDQTERLRDDEPDDGCTGGVCRLPRETETSDSDPDDEGKDC